MDVYIVSLFPEMLRSFAAASIVGRAVEQGILRVHEVQLRDFCEGKHKKADDTPYGGGNGMVMMVPPIVAALESLPETEGGGRPRRILMSPSGKPFTQRDAERLSVEPALAFVCGRYEGVDQRVATYIDEELSLGDFVLTGGELGAAVIVDAVSRMLPGVLGNHDSGVDESHGRGGTLEYPQYTRPAEFRGETVPAVLSSGDHKRVARWRRWQALRRTRERRPDLFAKLTLDAKELKFIDGEEP